MRLRKGSTLITLPALLLMAFPAFAAPTLSSGDTAFVFVTAVLVLMMTLPGLALFYGGLAQSKNVLSILMQVFATVALVAVLFTLFGYSYAFTDGGTVNSYLGGASKTLLRNITTDSLVGTVPEYVYIFFMLTFAAITPALIAGSFAERVKFSAAMVFIALWSILNYVPLAHMAWGGGWMAALSVQDFAGGDVVHINSGVAALVVAIAIGRRRQFGTVALTPHNMTMTLTGGCLLMIGWLGFCGGCALQANGYAMLVIFNTLLGACGGALAWMLLEWKFQRHPSLLGIVTGSVAGMVGITPACGYVGPVGALCVGALTVPFCMACVRLIKQRLQLDDAFDVFAIHGTGGIVGGLLTPLFALPLLGGQGYIAGRDLLGQLGVNASSIAFSILFSALTSWVAIKITAFVCRGLRVDQEAEFDGLDLTTHGEVGYRHSN
ncbi:ammonium transporter [Pantoea sp. A4]|uniref:ammonium transporter n=1 Tax=Pantoea sp. A4 TaxID=1225184 RepID=UPI00055A5261|nr:ammonium transporter [Pantoea sp. A4]